MLETAQANGTMAAGPAPEVGAFLVTVVTAIILLMVYVVSLRRRL